MEATLWESTAAIQQNEEKENEMEAEKTEQSNQIRISKFKYVERPLEQNDAHRIASKNVSK